VPLYRPVTFTPYLWSLYIIGSVENRNSLLQSPRVDPRYQIRFNGPVILVKTL